LPFQFFEIEMFSASQPKMVSLNQLCVEVDDCFGVDISKQAMDGKYKKPESVEFMKQIFESQLKDQLDFEINPDFLSRFSRVRIKDSTRYDLPANLKDEFEGNKGKYNSAAAISIQQEFDLRTGKVIDNQMSSIKRTDYQDAQEKVKDIEKDDLIIRDLGYYKTSVLETIEKKEAYFLTKLHANINIYDMDDNPISFDDIYAQMQKEETTRTERQVKIGEKEKFTTRLIIEIVSEEIVNERLRNAAKEAKKKKRNVSGEWV
jgi:hypothetical protein